MRGARHASLCGVVALTALIAGCGGSSYTKRDFITRADAICTGALRQARSITPGTSLPTYLADYLPVLESEAAQLQALRPPPGTAGDRALLAHYFAALRQAVAEYRQLAAAARSGDQDGVANAEAALGANQIYSLASSYGLGTCGTPGTTAV